MATTRSRSRRKINNNPGSSSSNQEIKDEIVQNDQFNVKCRCCLEDGDLKDMWATYFSDGERETYGEMISDCFSLAWQQPNEPEKICEMCITRVKDALSFKKQVLEVGQVLLEHRDQEIEEPAAKVLKEEIELLEELESEDSNTERLDNMEFDVESHDVDHSSQEEDNGAEYLDIEYLEDDAGVGKASVDTETVEPKRKWPKKKKKHERTMVYKNYTQNELRKSIQAVKLNMMTRSEAASFYNVPVKTLCAKLRAESKEANKDSSSEEEEEETKKNPSTDRQFKFFEEIKLILTYTNATPYKSKSTRYHCAYCSTDGPIFEDPDELRTHTRTQHATEKLRGVDLFMRPHWLNEVIKLDINNLQCTVCCKPIEKWIDMFEHLKETHKVDLSEAYTRVIPYKLTNDLSCALCGEKYLIYHNLDCHMNCHYSNYICGECGDTFLAESRLKKHLETHSVGKFPCKVCGKVFNLEKYRKKHFEFVHTKEAKIKCQYCTEKFRGEYARNLHVAKIHKEKLKKFTCEICKKVFDWRPYYLKHLRLTHGKKEKKHNCKLCDKSFTMPYQLKNHEDWHNSDSSNVCSICSKKFTSKFYLQKHYASHIREAITVTSQTSDADKSVVVEEILPHS